MAKDGPGDLQVDLGAGTFQKGESGGRGEVKIQEISLAARPSPPACCALRADAQQKHVASSLSVPPGSGPQHCPIGLFQPGSCPPDVLRQLKAASASSDLSEYVPGGDVVI